MQTHDQYNGVFFPNNSNFAGHLHIAGANTVLDLFGKRFWDENTDIHGKLGDGKKASLLDCVLHSQTRRHSEENFEFETEVFPNYVVIGEDFVRFGEPVIRLIRYHFENAPSLLVGSSSFRSLMMKPNDAHRLLEADYARSKEIADKHGWPKPTLDPEIDEHPIVLHYSGRREIVATDAKIGRATLTNRVSHSSRSAAGVSIDNKVVATIEFIGPKTVSEAVIGLVNLHRLFELSLGYRQQRYKWIEFELTHAKKHSEHVLPETAQLYWILCNERVEESSRTIGSEALLSPNRRPEEFAKVAAGWMDSVGTMGDPRSRFAIAFFGRYGINRIVGAANMFGILPDSRAPKKFQPDAQLKNRCETSPRDIQEVA